MGWGVSPVGDSSASTPKSGHRRNTENTGASIQQALECIADACIQFPLHLIVAAKAAGDICIEERGTANLPGTAEREFSPGITEVLFNGDWSAVAFAGISRGGIPIKFM